MWRYESAYNRFLFFLERVILLKKKEKQRYVNLPFMFAGTEPLVLTFDRFHIVERWSERTNKQLSGPMQCMKEIAKLLKNESLITIYERVPIYGTVALYLESENLYLFLSMGTRASQKQVRVSTLIYRDDPKKRVLVDPEDFCYTLFQNGKLQYGKNKKYFEAKTKTGYKVAYG